MRQLRALPRLLMAALIPSWRFFQEIGPSPRVEYRLLNGPDSTEWSEAMPRPLHVSVVQMVRRLFWNPEWNETLFLISCAERMVGENSTLAEREIMTRVARALPDSAGGQLQIRLVFFTRAGVRLQKTVVHESAPTPLKGVT